MHEQESGSELVKRASPPGCDVSHRQGSLNWATIESEGVQFAYIKATEGTTAVKYLPHSAISGRFD